MAERWVVFLILAGVAIFIGLLFFAGSAATRVQTTSFSLQPGPNYCTLHSFDLASAGGVTVTFSATPGTVRQYVMTAAEKQAFFSGSGLTDLGYDEAASDTFTASLPSGGTYYVVSCHGTTYEQTLQIGTHTMTITGLDPVPLYVGIGALLVGLLLVVVGLRSRSRALRARAVYAAWAGSYGTPPRPTALSASLAASSGMPTLRSLRVRFENASAAEETLRLSLNGAPLATVSVPAGRSAELDLHPNAPVPASGTMTVEAVSGSGQRAEQPVVPDAEGRASVALRLG